MQPAEEAFDPSVPAQLIDHGLAFLRSAAVGAAAKLRVADHLATGPLTGAELADRTGADPLHLRRLLRFLASYGIFTEDGMERFALTPMAQHLRTDSPHSLHSLLVAFTDPTFWLPAGRMHDGVLKGGTPFEEIFGASFFEHLERDPEAGQVFDKGMGSYSEGEAPLFAASYPFPETGTVVDVGGGHGSLLRAVLAANPGLTGVLFDREPVLRGHRLGDAREAAGRWRLEAGDFFEAVPAGADFYVIKHVLHDWDDEQCVRLLRTCRRAMADGGRVLVVDAVLPSGDEPHIGKALDILMLALVPGRERQEDEFRGLFARADLSMTRILPMPGGMSIIEAVAAPREA